MLASPMGRVVCGGQDGSRTERSRQPSVNYPSLVTANIAITKTLPYCFRKFQLVATNMRLLNVETHQLEEFFESSRPPYAILSHTWGKNETTYQDLRDGRKEGQGWNKIEAFCSKAYRKGYEYVWVDTCCIDKSSSAELSEAINSMYQWYQDSEICYVYMSDVPPEEDHFDQGSAFRRSRWFSRGWTLQEFLAPKAIRFYDQSWHRCFEETLTRKSYPRASTLGLLDTLLSEITGISQKVVETGYFKSTIIAQRLSWASRRETTRIEDMAYSLLGILDINMPLLYGEGKAAFRRLQEEMLKTNLDQSYLCWGLNMSWDQIPAGNLHLAESPAFFQNCQDLGSHTRSYQLMSDMRLQSITNQGLLIELPILEIDKKHCIVLAILPYGPPNTHYSSEDERYIAIPLLQAPGHSYFRRLDGSTPFLAPWKLFQKAQKKQVFILDSRNSTFNVHEPERMIPKANWIPSRWIHKKMWIKIGPLLETGYRMAGNYPSLNMNSWWKEIHLPWGIDFLFMEFAKGQSRIGAYFHGTLRSQTNFQTRLFRIHRGSALKIALSIQRSQNVHLSKKKWFDEELELEELCSDSTCSDTSHLHLVYKLRHVPNNCVEIDLKEIRNDEAA